MKSYSGIPYTTGKQAADDVKTQLVGFIKIPKWLLGLCLITVFYILFVCFSMYKIGDSTTQLYEYPYTVSRKAQEMKTALYGMRISLPSLLATPGITIAEIDNLLREQMAMQNKSLEEITLKFRGNEKELAYLKRCMAELREARKNMVNNLLGNLDFQYINAYYAREVLPHFEKVDKLLGNLGDAAEHRGNAILAEMDKLRTFSIIATLLMGISIILLILHTRKLEWDKYKESAYREKLLNLLAANIDEIFFISREDKSFEYVSSNSERVIGVPPEKFIHDYSKLYSLLECKDSDWLRAVFDDTSSNMKERDVVLGEEGRRFNIRVYPIFLNGVLSQRIIVLFDQTKEFAYRQALSDALENARNANTAKSNFLSHMSHEIRTPMNAIIGMTVIALTRLDDRSRMEDCLTKIALSSRHCSALSMTCWTCPKSKAASSPLLMSRSILKYLYKELSILFSLKRWNAGWILRCPCPGLMKKSYSATHCDLTRFLSIFCPMHSNSPRSGALYGWRYTSSIKRTIMCSSALLSVIRALV